jgi:hypothetical protein
MVPATKASITIRLDTGVLYKEMFSKPEIRENQLCGSHSLCQGVNDFLSIHWMTNLGEIQYSSPNSTFQSF